jgi:hypothetical protein
MFWKDRIYIIILLLLLRYKIETNLMSLFLNTYKKIKQKKK